jgi:hypothetical protein
MFDSIKALLRPALPKEKTLLDELKTSTCPDCGGHEFFHGPEGGMAVNIGCTTCGSWFNYAGFYAERIHNDNQAALGSSRKNWVEFNHQIWETYERVVHKQFLPTEALDWCAEHTHAPWAVKDAQDTPYEDGRYYYFFFQDKADALQFKLTWG